MARRRKGSRSGKWIIDGFALKVGGILFNKWKGPEAVNKVLAKDISGGLKEWGSGSIAEAGMASVEAGIYSRVREKLKFYTRPYKSKKGEIRM